MRPLYVAFASGALSYDCRPCGRCCRGLGIADDLVHLRASPRITQLAPWIEGTAPAGRLATFFTYADGCRHLEADNLCSLHKEGGAGAKPRICRLFPFSKLVDLGGLWTLLPHPSCPWTASAASDALSEHPGILLDLDAELLATLTPEPRAALTPLPAAQRLTLESAIRDGIDRAAPAEHAFATVRAAHQEHHAPAASAPDPALWLDLLRSAGEPPRLSAANTRLLNAVLPAIRVELAGDHPLDDLPTALEGFELWLRCLMSELVERPLSGEDLMQLLGRARPLLKVLSRAERPIPVLPAPAVGEAGSSLVDELAERVGEPLGETLLQLLRPFDRGAIGLLAQVGALL